VISSDTIVAISSAVGPTARMIVRTTGPHSLTFAHSLLETNLDLPPARASRAFLRIESLRFPATLHIFRAPHSATGEDTVEFHIPGNPLLARLLLDALIAAGARQAQPGEFTARAYFNGRLDLSAAEGVGAIIAAQNQHELDAARRLLGGELSQRLATPTEMLAQTLALVEADIDFSGEQITILSLDDVRSRIAELRSQLAGLIRESARFESLSHEPRIALVGRPNAGKSTLLNALAASDRAIVSPVAGTTRDVLSAQIALDHGIATVLDAAGIDEEAVDDDISRQMHQASLRAVETADVVVLIREIGDAGPPLGLPIRPHLEVRTKIDLSCHTGWGLAVSAHTGQGIPALRQRLDTLAFGSASPNPRLALTARHLQCIAAASNALDRAAAIAEPELIALELREALDALGEILGAITPDDVLTRIFSTFCIGK
jgi:tRNA modification GTPase